MDPASLTLSVPSRTWPPLARAAGVARRGIRSPTHAPGFHLQQSDHPGPRLGSQQWARCRPCSTKAPAQRPGDQPISRGFTTPGGYQGRSGSPLGAITLSVSRTSARCVSDADRRKSPPRPGSLIVLEMLDCSDRVPSHNHDLAAELLVRQARSCTLGGRMSQARGGDVIRVREDALDALTS